MSAHQPSHQPSRRDSHHSALALVHATRHRLAGILWTRALLVGAGASLAALLLWRVASRWRGALPLPGEPLLLVLMAIAVGVGIAAFVRRRSGEISLVRAALWIEERTPAGFALVTLAEAASGFDTLDGATRRGLDEAASVRTSGTALAPSVRRLARRQLAGPASFALGALAILLLSRIDMVGDPTVDAAARRGSPAQAASSATIGSWRVQVTPPGYSGLAAARLGDVNSVRVLAGSRVSLTGDGAPPWVVVRVVDANGAAPGPPARAVADGGDWRVTLPVAGASLEMRATRGGVTRLLLVESYGDSIPRVVLRLPARDSVLRTAEGRLAVDATAHDDLGLATGAIELIVSSGEGERFTARAVTVGATRFGGRRDATIATSLDLKALALGPGDIVHLRAVARDGHPGAGREAGSSETRSFRIARASEYDSVAVEPAPPPAVDSSLLSQRMLLMLTERLEKRRPTITRQVLVAESQRLARDQARLRLSVGSVVFQRLSGEQGAEHAHFAGDGHEHAVDAVGGKLALPGRNANGTLDEGDDSPIIAVNRPLLEAYNAMWDAGRALEQAEPKAAIPHMRLALAAIERARAASRLYLRGKPPTVIVDLAKVRLAGKDTGSTNARTARDALPASDARRERRLLAAASLLETEPMAGRDSLAVLRLESVGDAPRLAEALSAALDALRAGRDMTPALLRARRSLGGVVRTAPSGWSRGGLGAPP